MNVALHGMEQAAGVRFWEGGSALRAVPGTPVLVRYADDLAACARPARRPSRSRHGSPGGWSPGASRYEAKHEDRPPGRGFDFLGFSIRRSPTASS